MRVTLAKEETEDPTRGWGTTLAERLEKPLAALVFFVAFLWFAQKIQLATADLGRHIMNGRMLARGASRVLDTNFYSITEPARTVLNHHWGAGVIFNFVHEKLGFEGLSLFYGLLMAASVLLFYLAARRRAGSSVALVAVLLVLPVAATRREIRPEGFSYLFLGLFLWAWDRAHLEVASRTGARNEPSSGAPRPQLSLVKLWWLIPLQILWVNLHIFFFLGPFCAACAVIGEAVNGRPWRRAALFALLLALSCLANPFGFHGALAPLTIFEEYGYMLAENQHVFFMQERFSGNPAYLHFEILAALTLGAIFWMIHKREARRHLAGLVVLLLLGTLAICAVRGFTLFALAFIPACATFLAFLCRILLPRSARLLRDACLGLSTILLVVAVFPSHYLSPFSITSGLGLFPNAISNDRPMAFFKLLKAQGPIFNNYDIGGYLIFHLFTNEPSYSVFVDNRPEAYSAAFFKETYIPMQADEDRWREAMAKYNFGAIIFYRRDLTPWGQPFLIRRLEDPEWAPVYASENDDVIIYLRRTEANRRNIELMEPQVRKMFRVTRNG